jgi:uncharacterized hydrophobic protein (TIGR00271 family)
VLQLRVFGTSSAMAAVADSLQGVPGARHVIQMGNGEIGGTLVSADLVDDAVDRALEQVMRLGVAAEDVALVRLESVGTSVAQRPLASVVWSDLLSQAGANARPFPRYLVFMAAAGIIAAFGVIYQNGILVVGAMAISPDTLPITAAATALVLLRWRLAGRAVVALVLGLGVACVVGGLMTGALNALDLLPKGSHIDASFLAGLSTVNISTPIVAFAAGVAGMLALETRANSAVGVAISVTTIPASAYLGVAAGVGEIGKAWGALLVLGINVSMLLLAGCLTLLVQRALGRTSGAELAAERPPAP